MGAERWNRRYGTAALNWPVDPLRILVEEIVAVAVARLACQRTR